MPHSQRGITLIEALLSFVILAFGMLGIARLHVDLRAHADLARQRTDATRIAGEDMERLRAFSVLGSSGAAPSYAAIATASIEVADSTGGAATRYTIERHVATIAGEQAADVAVVVHWTDRRDGAQHAALNSVIARSDPVLAAALTTAPSGTPVKGVLGRSPRIPLFAKDLGDGRSAFKPIAGSTVAFVQDNRSGLITARCTGVATTLTTAALTAAALTGCDAATGHLLSGTVRFANTSPPDPANANATPLPFDIVLALSGDLAAPAPACYTAVQLDNPEDRRSLYHCVVFVSKNGRWSGRSTLAPIGWRIGTAAGDYRVCRYSSDLDGSGAIDRNIEHPSTYLAVDSALMQQNFLIVAGPDSCPTAAARRVVDGGAGDVYADLSTAQHQP
ncbi:MAG TPA: prepilin-type N-terminal cleavage/methylation domain-containing protein [Burkholderiaceae bacterium]|nr:prepilin-type N-terminal cleavage/methylation domain-containing protein [Burkholderiaceae bacterium]